MNRQARDGAASLEVLHYPDGEIVQFDNDKPAAFFDAYLADVADVEDLEDGARLKFPAGEVF